MPKKGSGTGGFFSSFTREKSFLGYFALLRVFVGSAFLTAGWEKYQHGWLSPDLGTGPLARMLTVWISGPPTMPHNWYRSFLTGIVMPNAHLFGSLICLVEIVIGLLLILGLLSRLSALTGAFLSLNFLLATWHISHVYRFETEAFIVCSILILLSAAGRSWGADWFLRRAWPKSILW